VPNDVLIDQSFRHGAWERMTAQRLLVERDAQVAVPQLRQAVREMDGARPSLIQRGVHALWTLEGLRALDDDTLIYALQFRDPRVSEQAARLAEGRVRESPEILDAVCNCVLVNDPKVHLRVALALADVDNPQAIEALATIAVSSADDPWIRIAVLSSAGHNVWPLLKTLLSTKHAEAVSRNESTLLLLEQGASLVGARDNNDERLACMLLGGDDSLALEARLALLAGITDGMSRRGLSLTSLRDSSTEAASVVSQHILPLLAIAAKQSMSTESSEIVRVRAITTLARCQPEIAAALLPRLLRAEQPPTLQATAARLLGEMLDRQVAASALEQWNELSVDTRRLLLGAMLRAPSLAEVVLDGIDNDQLSTTDLDAASIEQLRRLPGDALEQRVKRLFADDPSSDRQGVVDRYQAAIELKGDAHRGAAIFRAHCQACHRLQQQGHRVGPDLTAVAARPPAALLEDLLNPSKEVAPDYMNFVLVTHSGTVISGLVAGETADAVTLRRSEGIEEVISRSDMQQLRGTGKSLMPEGFEQQLAPQDIADVIRFLHNPSE
jgi:putative heme-binding domain-containing protein